MFNKKIKDLKQRIDELENTCKQLEELVDAWKEACDSKDFKISELNYRLQLANQEKLEFNNVISNLMEKLNKSNVKNIRQARKIEADNHDKATSI